MRTRMASRALSTVARASGSVAPLRAAVAATAVPAASRFAVRSTLSLASVSSTPRRSFSAAASSGGPALVLADHDNTTLGEVTLHAVTAASRVGASEVVLLVLGSGAGGKAVADQAAKVAGVGRVIFVDDASFAHALAEQSSTVAAVAKAQKASHVIAATSASGKNILPRLGAHLDVQPITEVIEIASGDTFVRPVYAGNAIATVQSSDAIKVLTVRPTSFAKASAEGGAAKVETAPAAESPASAKSTWQKEELTKSERPELGSARIVVAGGRGLKSKENFALVEALADAMGGAVGASRAAVDAGYVPNDYQVGQTGKVVAPDLYVAVGISGAIQHLAGMKDSKIIVAINKDKEAPIFQVADYGLEGDLFKILPEMTKLVQAAKAK